MFPDIFGSFQLVSVNRKTHTALGVYENLEDAHLRHHGLSFYSLIYPYLRILVIILDEWLIHVSPRSSLWLSAASMIS